MKRNQGTITASACSTWFSCPRSQCRWASPSPLGLDRAPGARSCGRSEGQTVSPALGRRLMPSPPNREPCSHGGHSACVCMCTRVLSLSHTHTHTCDRQVKSKGGYCDSDSKGSACNTGDPSWIPGWEDPLENGMATYSSIHAWRIPWTEEPTGLHSMGSQRVGHD